VELLAHRGAAAPPHSENTLPAIEAALADGAEGVEVDVRLTADGALVCSHDANLRRVAGRDLLVHATTYAHIARVRVGGAQAAPPLLDVLDTVAGRGRLVVEVKAGGPPGSSARAMGERTARAVGALLEPLAGRDVTVSSFDTRSLRLLAARHPSLPTALLTSNRVRAVRDARRLGCSEVHVAVDEVDATLVSAARLARLRLVPWTVQRPAQLERVRALGVPAAIVDAPLHMRADADACAS
jgi:glycerophosphoryl diester phosphodiesterase